MYEDCIYVEAIARYGSISQAAREAHISQPGLSQRLKRLEGELGCELFDRASTPLRLTPSGEIFLRYARTAVAAEEAMQREVRSMTKRARRHLHIGVSTPRANALIGDAIVDYYESHRGCALVFHSADDEELLHKLFIDGTIDCAVLTPVVPTPSLYQIEALCQERLLLAVSPDFRIPQLDEHATAAAANPAYAPEHISSYALEGIPFVLPSCGHYADTLVGRFFDDAGAKLDIAVNGCSPELALSLVREGLGATIVPSTLLRGANLRVFEVDGLDVSCNLNYVRIASRPVSDEEALFVSFVKKRLID